MMPKKKYILAISKGTAPAIGLFPRARSALAIGFLYKGPTMASPAASSATATNLATRKSLLTSTIEQNSVMSYQRVFAIAVLIMALGAHNCLSNPLPDPSPSAGSGCAEGSTTSKPTALNCPNEAPSTTKAEENAVLAQLHCNVSSLWEKSLNACVELSAFSVSTNEHRYSYRAI